MPPLDVDEPDAEPSRSRTRTRPPPPDAVRGRDGRRRAGRRGGAARRPAGPGRRRPTPTATPTPSMRVPGADELAGGARGTARAPRAPGERRAGLGPPPVARGAVRRRRHAGRRGASAAGGRGGRRRLAGHVGATTGTPPQDASTRPQRLRGAVPEVRRPGAGARPAACPGRVGRGRSRYAGGVAVVDVSEELKSLSSTMGSIEAVLDLDKMRADIAVLEEQAAAPSLWDDPEEAQKITSKLSHLQARAAQGRGAARPDRRPRGALRARRGARTTRTPAPRPRPSSPSVRKALDEMEVRTLLSGEYDAARGAGQHPRRGRWRRRRRLRRAAAADVPALGRAARLPDRGLRDVVRGRGRHQVDHLRRQGAVRLRHALRRAGHPPPGAHLALRQPGPPPDLLRRRRGAARRRADRPHRDRRVRAAGRRLPLLRPRRPGRQHHRLRGADHPPAHRHRRLLPERALADPEQGDAR